MRTYMIYLLLTGKRLLRQLPYFLAELAVMVLLVGMAAFSASKVLYGETSLKKIEVGVVLPEDDALSEKIMNDCLAGQRKVSATFHIWNTMKRSKR